MISLRSFSLDKTVKDLVICGNKVYALSNTGQIFVRCEVTLENPVGLYWATIPGEVAMLSGMLQLFSFPTQ